MLRAPAAYLDVCHKNGVSTSVVAAIAWGAAVGDYSPEPHGPNIKAMTDGGYEKLLRYLRYYGVDGVGYNSEFRTSTEIASAMQDLFAQAHLHADEYDVDFSVAWYSLTSDGGVLGGYNGLNSSNDDWFWNTRYGAPVANYFFPNYNWANSELQTSESTANGFREGASWDVYMGMDMQGRDYANWTMLKDYEVSFGMWGAHNMNSAQHEHALRVARRGRFVGHYSAGDLSEAQRAVLHRRHAESRQSARNQRPYLLQHRQCAGLPRHIELHHCP